MSATLKSFQGKHYFEKHGHLATMYWFVALEHLRPLAVRVRNSSSVLSSSEIHVHACRLLLISRCFWFPFSFTPSPNITHVVCITTRWQSVACAYFDHVGYEHHLQQSTRPCSSGNLPVVGNNSLHAMTLFKAIGRFSLSRPCLIFTNTWCAELGAQMYFSIRTTREVTNDSKTFT